MITGFDFGDDVEYTCMRGYELIGESRFDCGIEGKWSGDAPECVPVRCPNAPTPIAHATYISISANVNDIDEVLPNTVNDVKNAVCDEGFEFFGDESVTTCSWTGEWTPLEVTCKPIECSPAPRIVHGHVVSLVNTTPDALTSPTPLNRTFTAVVVYTCKRGYRLRDSKADRLTCASNRRWSGVRPRCSRNTCGPPPYAPSHSTLTSSIQRSYSIGQKVTYNCTQGYGRDNIKQITRICTNELSWSIEDNMCLVILCPRPETPKHGNVIVPSLAFESPAHYSCKLGYDIVVGNKVAINVDEVIRICNVNGEWTNEDGELYSPPTCSSKLCQLPPDIPNAFIVNNKNFNESTSKAANLTFEYGDTVTYSCRKGFTASSSRGNTLICSSDRRWRSYMATDGDETANPLTTSAIYKCTRNKCASPSMQSRHSLHGDIVVTDLRNGSQSARLHCHNGYISPLSPSPDPMCTDQKWTGVLLACVRRSCRRLPVLDHATPMEETEGQLYKFEARVLYACETGYESGGELMVECRADGKWAWLGGQGACLVGQCPLPPFIPHGLIASSTESFNFGSRVEFKCSTGFTLQPIGSRGIVCGERLSWEGVVPRCVASYCSRAAKDPRIQHSMSMMPISRSAGSRITFTSCQHGYEYFGNSRAVCQGSPLTWTWLGDGRCSRRLCLEDPPRVTHAVVITAGAGIGYGDTMNYRCISGYRNAGGLPSLVTTCSINPEDSTKVNWSEVFGMCLPVLCEKPKSPTNGYMKYSNHSLVFVSRFCSKDNGLIIF